MSTLSRAVKAMHLLVLDAEHLELPEPRHIGTPRDGAIDVHLDSLADLTAWALWADSTIDQSGCGVYVISALDTTYRDHDLRVTSVDAKQPAGAAA